MTHGSLRGLAPRRGLVALLLSALATGASAGLLSAGDGVFGAGAITVDTATNLQWLDLTLSGTRSYNDMTGADGSNEFAAGGAFAGFRYATMAEVKQLWINAGIPEASMFFGIDPVTLGNIGTFSTNNALVFANARALQELIGYELTEANPPFLNAGGWRSAGLALDAGGIGYPSLDTCTVGTGFCGGSSIGITRAHLDGVDPSYWQPLIGFHHWLVRDAAVEAVPEPGASLLVLAAFGSLALARRIARKPRWRGSP